MSLILINPAPDRNPTNKRWDAEAKLEVKEIKVVYQCTIFQSSFLDICVEQTTLIVTPPALAPQWADELAAHAPGLKVLIYEGWSKVDVLITNDDVEHERERRNAKNSRGRKIGGSLSKAKKNAKGKAKMIDEGDNMVIDEECTSMARDDDILDWCSYVNTFDVCITTYNVLRQDLTVAHAPPKRPRRADVEYSNLDCPRSPLVMCEWYRVIMDEVQMVSGKSE